MTRSSGPGHGTSPLDHAGDSPWTTSSLSAPYNLIFDSPWSTAVSQTPEGGGPGPTARATLNEACHVGEKASKECEKPSGQYLSLICVE
jgi:hypothetical protein